MASPGNELAVVECGAFASVPWLQLGVAHREDKNGKAATIAKPFAIKNLTAEQITVTLDAIDSADFTIIGYNGSFVLDAGMSASFSMQWTATALGPVRHRLNVHYGQGKKVRLGSMIIAGECKQSSATVRRTGTDASRRHPQQQQAALTDSTNTAVTTLVKPAARRADASDIPVQIYVPGDRPKPSEDVPPQQAAPAHAQGGLAGPRAGKDVPVQIYAPQPRQAAPAAASLESELDRELAAAFAAFDDTPRKPIAAPSGVVPPAATRAHGSGSSASTSAPPSYEQLTLADKRSASTERAGQDEAGQSRPSSRGPPPAFVARMQQRQQEIDKARQVKQQEAAQKAEAAAAKKRGRSASVKQSQSGRPSLGFSRPKALKLASIVPSAAAGTQGGGGSGGIAAGAGTKRARVLAPAWQGAVAGAGFGSPAVQIYEAKPKLTHAPAAGEAGAGGRLSLARPPNAPSVPCTPGSSQSMSSSTVLLFSPAYGAQGRRPGAHPPKALKAFGLAPPPPTAAAGAQTGLFTPAARGGAGGSSNAAALLMSPSAQAYAGLLSPRQAAKMTFGISKKRTVKPVQQQASMPVELGSPITWAKLARGVPMGTSSTVDGQNGAGGLQEAAQKKIAFRFSKAANDRRQRAAATAHVAPRGQTKPAPAVASASTRQAPLSRHAHYVPVTVPIEGEGSKGAQAREEGVLTGWLNSLLAPGLAVAGQGPAGSTSTTTSATVVPADASAAVIRGAAQAYASTCGKMQTQAAAFVAGQERNVRTQALRVLMSGPVASASASLRRDMDCGRMQAKPDVNPFADQTLRARLTSLLVNTYHPSWLAVGLEVVYGTSSLSKALSEVQDGSETSAAHPAQTKARGATAGVGMGMGMGMGPKRASSQALRGRTASFLAPKAMSKPLKRASSAPMLSQSHVGGSSLGLTRAAPAAVPAKSAGEGMHLNNEGHGGKGAQAVSTREACTAALSSKSKRFLNKCFLVDQQACARAVRLQSKRKEFGLTSQEHIRQQQQALLTRFFTLIMFLDKARSGGEGQTALLVGAAGSKRAEGSSLVAAGRALLAQEPRLPPVAMDDGKAMVEAKETAYSTLQQGKRTACTAASAVMEALTRFELPPCLFLPSSPHKSSREVACTFAKEVLRGEGDVMRHLTGLGFDLSTVQTKLDELVATPSAWVVQDVRHDLRDGARLVRLAEVLTGLPALSLCRANLRIPAVSRTTKIHHVQKALECFAERLGLCTSGLSMRAASALHPAHSMKGTRAGPVTQFRQRVSYGRKGKVTRTVTVNKASKGRVSILVAGKGGQAGAGKQTKVIKRTGSSLAVRAGATLSVPGALSTPIRVLPGDIVDGDVERSKALLWTLLQAHTQGVGQGTAGAAATTATEAVPVDLLDAEVNRLCLSSKAAADYISVQGARGPQSLHASESGPVCAVESEAALLRWLQAAVAAATAGIAAPVHVTGWSGVGVADGRALCLLLSRYQPRVLPRKTVSVRGTTAALLAPQQNEPGKLVFRPGVTQAQAQAALSVERAHFKAVGSAMSALGCASISLPALCDSAHPPDVRLVKALLAILARKLLVDNAEGRAARTIQRWTRAVQARLWVVLQARTAKARHLACAAKISNWYKALLPLKAWRDTRRHAATVLSAAWRALQARRQLYRLKLQAYHVAMVERNKQAKAMAARQALQQLRAADRCVAAARVLQRAWRYCLDRRAERAWRVEKARFVSRVTLVQAAVRGWRVRFRPALSPHQWGLGRQVSLETIKGAAQTVQDAWRCCLARRVLEGLRERRAMAAVHAQEAGVRAWAATAIAAWWKGRVAQAQFLEARGAANMITAAWRGFSAQRRFTAVRTVASVLGRRYRAVLAARKLAAQDEWEAHMQLQAATRIVAWAKGVLTRYECGRMRFAAVLVQSFWRGWLVRQDYLLYKEAACVLQQAWRAHAQRLRVRRQALVRAVRTLQSHYRGGLVRARVGSLLSFIRAGVTRLQAMVRGAQARKRVAEMLHRRQVAEHRSQLEAQMLREAIADATPARSAHPSTTAAAAASVPATPTPMSATSVGGRHTPAATPSAPVSAGVGPRPTPMVTPAVAAITALRSATAPAAPPPPPPDTPVWEGGSAYSARTAHPMSTPRGPSSAGNALFLSPPVPLVKPVPVPAAAGGGLGRSAVAAALTPVSAPLPLPPSSSSSAILALPRPMTAMPTPGKIAAQAATGAGASYAAGTGTGTHAVDLSLSFDAEEEEEEGDYEGAPGAGGGSRAVDMSLMFDTEPDYEPSAVAHTVKPPLPHLLADKEERAVQQARKRAVGAREPAPVWVGSPAHASVPSPLPAAPMSAPSPSQPLYVPTPSPGMGMGMGRSGLHVGQHTPQAYLDTLASAKQAAYEAALLAGQQARAATLIQALWRGCRDRELVVGMRIAAVYRKQREEALQSAQEVHVQRNVQEESDGMEVDVEGGPAVPAQGGDVTSVPEWQQGQGSSVRVPSTPMQAAQSTAGRVQSLNVSRVSTVQAVGSAWKGPQQTPAQGGSARSVRFALPAPTPEEEVDNTAWSSMNSLNASTVSTVPDAVVVPAGSAKSSRSGHTFTTAHSHSTPASSSIADAEKSVAMYTPSSTGSAHGLWQGEGPELPHYDAGAACTPAHGLRGAAHMKPFGFGLASSASGVYAAGAVLAASAAPIAAAEASAPLSSSSYLTADAPAAIPTVAPAAAAVGATLTRTDSSSTLGSVASFLGSVGGLGLSAGVGLVSGVVAGVVQGVKAVGGQVPGPGALLRRGRKDVWETGSASTDESDVSVVEEEGEEQGQTAAASSTATVLEADSTTVDGPEQEQEREQVQQDGGEDKSRQAASAKRSMLFSPGQFGDENMLLDKTVAEAPAASVSFSSLYRTPSGPTPAAAAPGTTPAAAAVVPATSRSSGSNRSGGGVKPWQRHAATSGDVQSQSFFTPTGGSGSATRPSPLPMPTAMAHHPEAEEQQEAPRSSGSQRAAAYAAARRIATLDANATIIQATVRCWLAHKARLMAVTEHSMRAAHKARATHTVAAWMYKWWHWRKTMDILELYMLGALREHKRRRAVELLARQAAAVASARGVMRAMAQARAKGQLVAKQAAVSAHQKAVTKTVVKTVVEEAARMAAMRRHVRAEFTASVCSQLPMAAAAMAAKHAHRQMGRQAAHAAADKGRAAALARPSARANAPSATLRGQMAMRAGQEAARLAQQRVEDLKAQALRSVALRRKLDSAATAIQAALRGFLCRLQHRMARGTLVLLQAWWRGCAVRAQLGSLRAERELQVSLQQERARQAHEETLLRQRGPAPRSRAPPPVTLPSLHASIPATPPVQQEEEEWQEASEAFARGTWAAALPAARVGRASISARHGAVPAQRAPVPPPPARAASAAATQSPQAVTLPPPWAQTAPAPRQHVSIALSMQQPPARDVEDIIRVQACVRGVLCRNACTRLYPTLAQVRLRARNAEVDRQRGVTQTLRQRWIRATSHIKPPMALAGLIPAVDDLTVCVQYSNDCVRQFIQLNIGSYLFSLLPLQDRTPVGHQVVRKMLALLLTVAESKYKQCRVEGLLPISHMAQQRRGGPSELVNLITQHVMYLPVVRPALILLRLLLESSSHLRSAFCVQSQFSTLKNWHRIWSSKAKVLDKAAGPGKTAFKQYAMRTLLGIEPGTEDFSAEGTARDCKAVLDLVSQPHTGPTVPVPFKLSGTTTGMGSSPAKAMSQPAPPFASPSKTRSMAGGMKPVVPAAAGTGTGAAFMSPPKVKGAGAGASRVGVMQALGSPPRAVVSPRPAAGRMGGSPRGRAGMGMGMGALAGTAPSPAQPLPPFRPVGVNVSPPKASKAVLAPLPTNAMRLVPNKPVAVPSLPRASSSPRLSHHAAVGVGQAGRGTGGQGAENDSLGDLLNAPFTGTVGLVPVNRRVAFNLS